MSEDGERIEKSIMQMHRDLIRGKFTLKELEFFKLSFDKLSEATGNAIKRAGAKEER